MKIFNNKIQAIFENNRNKQTDTFNLLLLYFL